MSSLWESIAAGGSPPGGEFHAPGTSMALKTLAGGSLLAHGVERLRGRNVLLATRDQLPSAVALAELDGVARRLVLCTPDLTPAQLQGVAATAQAQAIVIDRGSPLASGLPAIERFETTPLPVLEELQRRPTETTEWILLTSGTTGVPKLVVHTFDSLAGALPRHPTSANPLVWSTFYDIRRYGGLQIYLRAVLAGAPLVLSSAGESTRDFLARAAAAGVTHISGTPSHWRHALMSGAARLIAPEYVRLSGEVADQPVLDNLRAAYPDARIGHAFASTEAGVAFDVNDGVAGFPAEYIGQPRSGIEMQVRDGTLWIRSGRTAARYLGEDAPSLPIQDGYVDTGDMVELVNGRYYFRGRKGGIINVGGLKVYPEEVEAVLNADPRVRISRVMARRNPITGAVVVAEVVLSDPPRSAGPGSAGSGGTDPGSAEPGSADPGSADPGSADPGYTDALKNDLLERCRRTLAAHKVPALLRFVPALELTAAGKLVRP